MVFEKSFIKVCDFSGSIEDEVAVTEAEQIS